MKTTDELVREARFAARTMPGHTSLLTDLADLVESYDFSDTQLAMEITAQNHVLTKAADTKVVLEEALSQFAEEVDSLESGFSEVSEYAGELEATVGHQYDHIDSLTATLTGSSDYQDTLASVLRETVQVSEQRAETIVLLENRVRALESQTRQYASVVAALEA